MLTKMLLCLSKVTGRVMVGGCLLVVIHLLLKHRPGRVTSVSGMNAVIGHLIQHRMLSSRVGGLSLTLKAVV